MLNLYYANLNFSLVTDLTDFYKSNLAEVNKVKGLINNSKLLFNLPPDRVKLEVSEGDRVYRITLLNTTVNKEPIGFLIYMPLLHRLDLYTSDMSSPYIQWKNKKPVFKNYDTFLDKAGVDKIFSKLINVI